MIAYHFPPENAIGAARPYRFYKYLAKFGWRPVVITASRQDPARRLEDVHYVADPFEESRATMAWQTERVLRKFVMPGQTGMAWSKQVARFCEELLDSGAIDEPVALYSTFPPVGTHLAALEILKKRDLCWVADFRDPCFRDLYSKEDSRNPLTKLQIALASDIERKSIEQPAVVIANTDAEAKAWKARFPKAAERIRVIWNGFDAADDLAAEGEPAEARRVLIHTGTLYGGRHTGPVLESVDRLIRAGKLRADSVLLRFLGTVNEGSLRPDEAVAAGNEQGWLEVISTVVPRQEAIDRAREASGLFLIQPQSATQVPGKLFEYVRIGRPILAFIQRASPIEDILKRCGIPNVCVYPDDTAEQVDAALLRFFEIPAGPWQASRWFLETFDAAEQTRALCAHIEDVLEPTPELVPR